MRPFLVAFLLLSCSLAIPAGQEEPIKQDLAKLQGVWKVEVAMKYGSTAPPEQRAKMSLIFKGEELIPVINPKGIVKIKIDPSQKPAAMDLTERDKRTSLGIYEID